MRWLAACSPILGPRGGGDVRKVAAELQLAAAGPVEAVEGSLHQGCHDAAQAGLIRTAVALTVMLHAEPREGGQRAASSHTQGAHPWEDREVSQRWERCLDQASDCAPGLSFPTRQCGGPSLWMEAEAPLCPSIGPDLFLPESLAPADLYSAQDTLPG